MSIKSAHGVRAVRSAGRTAKAAILADAPLNSSGDTSTRSTGQPGLRYTWPPRHRPLLSAQHGITSPERGSCRLCRSTRPRLAVEPATPT
jgi:hypothetical protein